MKRILIIEDDLAILRGLKDNLEYDKYEVLTATDGEQGYCLVQEKKPDLIESQIDQGETGARRSHDNRAEEHSQHCCGNNAHKNR